MAGSRSLASPFFLPTSRLPLELDTQDRVPEAWSWPPRKFPCIQQTSDAPEEHRKSAESGSHLLLKGLKKEKKKGLQDTEVVRALCTLQSPCKTLLKTACVSQSRLELVWWAEKFKMGHSWQQQPLAGHPQPYNCENGTLEKAGMRKKENAHMWSQERKEVQNLCSAHGEAPAPWVEV